MITHTIRNIILVGLLLLSLFAIEGIRQLITREDIMWTIGDSY